MDILEKTSKLELIRDESNKLKLKVHREPIKKELKDKLADSDIELAVQLSMESVKIHTLLKDIAIGAKCENCPQACNQSNQTLFSRCMPYGNISSKLMFVNAMPTDLEFRIGSTHTDTTGVFLSLILNKMGIHKEQVYFTDFMKCNCKTADETALWTCAFQYLFNEISYIKPEVLVCEGIGVLKKLKESTLFEGLPDTLEYGKIYNVKYATDTPMKIMAIYELNKVLLKTGDDYKKCKNILWSQLNQVKNLIVS